MIKIKKFVEQAIPVTVLSLDKKLPLTGKELKDLRCTCCDLKLGSRPWGHAWIKVEDEKEKRGARLCENCCDMAEKQLKGKETHTL